MSSSAVALDRHGPWKPWYVWRPTQLAVRLWRACRPIPDGYRSISVAWGCAIVANPATTVGRSLWTTAVHDLVASEMLARLIPPGATVIDAGAHVGYMTVLAAVAAGEAGQVLAFEPHPDLFTVLRRNVDTAAASSGVARITVFNTALGERRADGMLALPPGFDRNDGIARVEPAAAAGAGALPIQIETIDAVLGDNGAAVLKIDVEGSELQVLRGAQCALKSGRIRHVVFEDFGGGGSEAAQLLESFGYRVYSLGWSVRGPRVGAATKERLAKTYEAPSYLATLDAAQVLERCSEPGWLVLRKHLGRSPCPTSH